MVNLQQGDVLLFQTLDDGNITIENGIVEMSGGLPTAVYLSLFGGNEDDIGSINNELTWWGNRNEIGNFNTYVSETQNILQSLPVTSSNLLRVEQAILRDLNWILEDNIASNIDITVSIPDLNKIKIIVDTEAFGQESTFEFVENWKAKT